MTINDAITITQAFFCGGLCFVIAFLYRRGDSTYKFMPSLCAFGLASLLGMQWMNLLAKAAYTGYWPEESLFNTLVLGILFLLVLRARGNVSRIFDLRKRHATN